MCKLCVPIHLVKKNWISTTSIKSHVESQGHLRAVERQKYEEGLREQLALEQQSDENERSRRTQQNQRLNNLRNVNITRPSGTVSSNPNPNGPQNTAFWKLSDQDFAIEEDSRAIEQEQLRREVEGGTEGWNSDIFGEKPGTEAFLVEDDEAELELLAMIQAANVDEEEQVLRQGAQTIPQDVQYYPYESKTMYLLDTIDNASRKRISSSVMQNFLWVLKESGVRDVPSLKRLRTCQEQLRKDTGIPSLPCKSFLGNIFHINDPRIIIMKDWTDPNVRPYLQIYPEIPEDGVVREIWHAEKWRKEMDLRTLSPMYDANGVHYYVFEVCQLYDGRFVIPIRWLLCQGTVHADAFEVVVDNEGKASILDNTTLLIRTLDLKYNFLDLQDLAMIPVWNVQKGYPSRMPNPDRVLAQGDPLYSSFIDYFGDDVSGNRSKSWNKHWNSYITHRNLPRQHLFQEYHVHFISTSPNAAISEQFHTFKKVVESTHSRPVQFRDPISNDSARFRLFVNSGPSDNPMQSEICSHMGQNANKPCRKCKIGGSRKDKTSDEGFHSFFSAGNPRSKEEIRSELREQLLLACRGVAKRVEERQTESGIKDPFTQHWVEDLLERFKSMHAHDRSRQKEEITAELERWVQEHEDNIITGFLTLKGFDPTKDTPIEILHTFLLGIVKYVWFATHSSWSDDQKRLYSLRLQSTLRDGLSIAEIRSSYIMQFANSLIGRQLKTVVQCSIFHLHGLVSDDLLQVWKAVGQLSALVWFPEIRDMTQYLSDVETATANVLDAFAQVDPSKIPAKLKLHLLTHLAEDIRRFGPLVGLSTEVFESFNSVFRSCSILSNHLAPSRDIALQLADQEGLKWRTSGGWWFSAERQEWVQAGPGIQELVNSQPLIQQLLGLSRNIGPRPCSVKLSPLTQDAGQSGRSRLTFRLASTKATKALNKASYNLNAQVLGCQHLVAQSGDLCKAGTWVVLGSPLDQSPMIGRISSIVQHAQTPLQGISLNMAVIEIFSVSDHRHPTLDLPVLYQPQSEEVYIVAPVENVKFNFNAQHDCQSAQCESTGLCPRRQERQDSELMETFIEHKPLNRYLVNLHSFHNGHLIREALPRQLVVPNPIYGDRKGHHLKCTQELRRNQGKRAVELAARKRAREEVEDDSD
ncbi:hypothetical protein V5O48_009279 [Marasmius crinis-equi]|uniref:Uncharacterized protein n=1 Tax=Marasmius crinis-equi TaxID=585013 RepID=A0ABR3FBK3_9AGAR